MHKMSDEFEFWPDQTTSSFSFDPIIIKGAGIQDRHKSSDEFDFRPDQTTHFRVTCP